MKWKYLSLSNVFESGASVSHIMAEGVEYFLVFC